MVALLRRQEALLPTLAADLICQAALGLAHGREKGLIHRDLKPGLPDSIVESNHVPGPAPAGRPISLLANRLSLR